MFTIENAIRKRNGLEEQVRVLAGLGNLTKDVESRIITTKNGEDIAVVGGYNGPAIAFNYWEQGEKQVRFYNIEAWGKTAENLARFGKKGSEMFVSGRLSTRTYVNKRGEEKEEENFVVELFQITSRSRNGENGSTEGGKSKKEEVVLENEDFVEIEDDEEDIPF